MQPQQKTDSPHDTRTPWDLKAYKNGTLLHLRVQPNASGNKITAVMDGMIRLKLKAPPVEGAANKCCIKYLSGLFHLAKSRIEIVRGLRSREKWVWIKEAEPEVLREKLEEALGFSGLR